jgi:hypothetical protein
VSTGVRKQLWTQKIQTYNNVYGPSVLHFDNESNNRHDPKPTGRKYKSCNFLPMQCGLHGTASSSRTLPRDELLCVRIISRVPPQRLKQVN